MDWSALQAQIDGITYPPTHTYTVAGGQPTPTGLLADRVDVLSDIVPRFFEAGPDLTFLDIGTSKGYFAARAAKSGAYVVGIEPDRASAAVADAVLMEMGRGTVCPSTFQSYVCDRQFDRVFIGNANHYLYREARGFAWVSKLAALCKPRARVLIEGPLGIECADAMQALPPELVSGFNRTAFLAALTPYFTVLACTRSIDYTPDRYALLLERRPDFAAVYDQREISHVTTISLNEETGSCVDLVLLNGRNLIYKHSRGSQPHLAWSVRLACSSPWSNGLVAHVYDGHGLAGWLEEPIMGTPFARFECETAVFRAHCCHNALLASMGYIDMDFGTVNWYANARGALRTFDKNAIRPISALEPADWDMDVGTIFRTLRFSHRDTPRTYLQQLSSGLATKNPSVLMRTFAELADWSSYAQA